MMRWREPFHQGWRPGLIAESLVLPGQGQASLSVSVTATHGGCVYVCECVYVCCF